MADMHTAQEFPQGKLRDVLVEFPVDSAAPEEGTEERGVSIEGKRGSREPLGLGDSVVEESPPLLA